MDDLFRDRVRERDLDNFLVEELHASTDFRTWFVGRVPAFVEPVGCVARLSKSPPREQDRRQTDVRLAWFDAVDAMRACLLIESKVTADLQPGQAAAYADEARALRASTGGAVATVIVAPGARLVGLDHGGAFDGQVALEDVIDQLEGRRVADPTSELGLRLQARVELLEALCGKRAGAGWIGRTVAEKRDFAEAYAELASEVLRDLRVRPSTDGPRAITRSFDGLDLPGLPGARLRHEFGSGVGSKYANVQFAGALDRLDDVRRSGLLDGTPYTVEPASKSLAIRVPTPAVDPRRPFADERAAVLSGLEAIRALVDWLVLHADELRQLLAPARRDAQSVGDAAALDRAFGDALRQTYRECEKLGYRPSGLLGMLERHGGAGTARRLLAGPPSEGFGRLVMLNRLDLTVEALVQQDRWRTLFTDEERRMAARRLR